MTFKKIELGGYEYMSEYMIDNIICLINIRNILIIIQTLTLIYQNL